MGARESYAPGTFSWAELVTGDADAAKAFYRELLGWTYDDQPAGEDATYTMAGRDGREVAGLFADPSQPPHWNSYVTVERADEAAERAASLGGTVVAPAFDVMDAGRMAVIQDPPGAFVMAWEAGRHPGARLVNAPGALTWNDLTTHDLEAAKRFYADWLGWEYEEMPDSGGYHVIRNGGRSNGGMMPARPEMGDVPSHWMPYFGVEDLDAALAQVPGLGGRVMAGRMEMPGGSIAVLSDPQGAVLALWHGGYDDDPA
jgi:predicted enzyme related to lactoylglutathione lyase